jgi:hypothetical protein
MSAAKASTSFASQAGGRERGDGVRGRRPVGEHQVAQRPPRIVVDQGSRPRAIEDEVRNAARGAMGDGDRHRSGV